MDINKICEDIVELFNDTKDISDVREYYYMIRKALDNSFETVAALRTELQELYKGYQEGRYGHVE